MRAWPRRWLRGSPDAPLHEEEGVPFATVDNDRAFSVRDYPELSTPSTIRR